MNNISKVECVELALVETPPVPPMTQAQQLTFAVTRCAELQARMHRKNGALTEAIMYLSVGAVDRAQQVLNRALIDL